MGNPQSWRRRSSVNSHFNQTSLVNHQVFNHSKIDVFSLGTQKTRAGWERGPQAGCRAMTCLERLQHALSVVRNLPHPNAKAWTMGTQRKYENHVLSEFDMGWRWMKFTQSILEVRVAAGPTKLSLLQTNFDLPGLDWISLSYLSFVHRISQ